jgi:hypothetical protein
MAGFSRKDANNRCAKTRNLKRKNDFVLLFLSRFASLPVLRSLRDICHVHQASMYRFHDPPGFHAKARKQNGQDTFCNPFAICDFLVLRLCVILLSPTPFFIFK